MKKISRPLIPVSVIALLVAGIFMFSCKFSFAESKKPQKDSITFGAKKKPSIKKPAQFESFKNVFADIAEHAIPTVVSVTSTKIDTVIYRDPFNQFFKADGPFPDKFFIIQLLIDNNVCPSKGQGAVCPGSYLEVHGRSFGNLRDPGVDDNGF